MADQDTIDQEDRSVLARAVRGAFLSSAALKNWGWSLPQAIAIGGGAYLASSAQAKEQVTVVLALVTGFLVTAVLAFLKSLLGELKVPQRERRTILALPLLVGLLVAGHSLLVRYSAGRSWFVPRFEMMSVGEIDSNTATVTIWLSVTNRGEPSTLDVWKARIITASGKELQPLPLVLGNRVLRLFPDEHQPKEVREFTKGDQLDEKTIKEAVETGGQRSGFLSYVMHGYPRDELMRPDTVYVLSCQDAYGKGYEFRVKYGDLEFGGVTNIPGLP
jgi:hypothetical protein